MALMDIFKERLAISFELFPPKTDMGMDNLAKEGGVIDKLYALNPDYISCTYGAGGSNVGKNLEVLQRIHKDNKCIPVTHFTCVSNTKEDIKRQLDNYLENGINHLLALRGDIPFGKNGTGGDFKYSSELVEYIRSQYGDKFTIAVSGLPEGHIESNSYLDDVEILKKKQDMGADYIITQLCWDLDQFERWLEAIRKAGITMPVDVGIMPITSISGTINMALSRNGCVLDSKLCRLISKYWLFPNPFASEDMFDEQKKEDFKKEGLIYTVDMMNRCIKAGINGVHLYALNKSEDVAFILKNSGLVK